MGFWSLHSGGERFYKTAANDAADTDPARHHWSVHDLEVSWAVDDDPECREAEELARLHPKHPVFNHQDARPCEREDCDRAVKLRNGGA